jgi:hypothetical protein
VSGLRLLTQHLPVGFDSPEAGKVHRNSPIRPESFIFNFCSQAASCKFPEVLGC